MFKTSVMAAAVTAAIGLSTTIAHAQSPTTPSLGEVARQTAEKRAASKKAKRVYTNASLEALPAEVMTSAPAEPAAAETSAAAVAATTPADAAKPAGPGKSPERAAKTAAMDEKYWREQGTSIRNELRQARESLGQQKPGTRPYSQAQRVVEQFERRWDNLVKSAQSAKVPMEWLGPRP
jgi:hypothetical protein